MRPEDVPEDLTITINDMRKSGFCAKGTRAWSAAHSLRWSDFLANGISARELLATGDGLAVKIVRETIARRSKDA